MWVTPAVMKTPGPNQTEGAESRTLIEHAVQRGYPRA
jgi:hypothetical protein